MRRSLVPEGTHTTTRVEWGIAYDDGDIDTANSHVECAAAMKFIDEAIESGDYEEADYAGRRIVKRTVVTTTTASPWEPA